MTSGTWLNLALPGAGLLLRGRLTLGLGFLLPGLFMLSGWMLMHVAATSTALANWRLALGGTYLLLAAAATVVHAILLRERVVDTELVSSLHRQIATAHLNNRHPEALADARRLTTVAPKEPGAWRLLALVAEGAGETKMAVKARTRATSIDAERQL